MYYLNNYLLIISNSVQACSEEDFEEDSEEGWMCYKNKNENIERHGVKVGYKTALML